MNQLETIAECLNDYFLDSGFDEMRVQADNLENTVYVYLDLPCEENYNATMGEIELFFSETGHDIEMFEIDGDYEGTITLEMID